MKKILYVTICLVICLVAVSACAHVHTYSEEWSWDENNHWHQATCEHTEKASDLAKHTFKNGVCSVCGAKEGTAQVTPQPIPTPNPEDNGYEFGDAVSLQNGNFYKDYSEEEKNLYYALWDVNTTVKVEVDIEQSELAKINEAYDDYSKGNSAKADIYRKCDLTLTVNGNVYRYEEVGIRMRGNTSRRNFVNDNGIYAFVHFRFSLTETFDGEEYEGNAWGKECYHDWSNDPEGRAQRKDRSFATMEKFYYKWNKCYDQTYIREVYANKMFQANGILAPHITLTQFCMKQHDAMESLGVGNLYELIDKQFIKRNFDKAHKGGDLYKCTYTVTGPADLTYIDNNNCGIETATQSYSYDLKTNDDPEDFNEHSYLKAFVNMLNSSGGNFESNLESMMDTEYFARFEAVNYLLGNPDCIRNHANNYYLYFTPKDADGNFKAYIIPYDYDRCLGVDWEWNPAESMVNLSPYAKTTTIDENGRQCLNPLYTKTLLNANSTKIRGQFETALQKVLDGKWFTNQNYMQMYNAYKNNYASLARPSQLILNQCSDNIIASRMVFSDQGSKDIRGGENLEVGYYMQQKRVIATSAH